jgi:hypothetical protein
MAGDERWDEDGDERDDDGKDEEEVRVQADKGVDRE